MDHLTQDNQMFWLSLWGSYSNHCERKCERSLKRGNIMTDENVIIPRRLSRILNAMFMVYASVLMMP